ncbi:MULTISPECIES: HAD-IIIC family phosphatase [unclassified Streptomyces]|uniref:HAD-IIIC family phosphatase n=1 Tax=unclassified Streptomyces TaxID=2593676 RepID=UPI0038075286
MIWDLDNTVWLGILQEGDRLALREQIREIFDTLDSWGILQSVSSRNDENSALAQLKSFGIDHWFLEPQVNWGAKHESVRRIAERLNIGTDSLLFIDDDPFEREEVSSVLGDVRTMDPAGLATLLERPDVRPAVVTAEGRRRRQMYQEDRQRRVAEENFEGPSTEFLASTNAVYTVRKAEEADLPRAGELTVRTNQLNATGRTFGIEELAGYRQSEDHELLVMELTDRFGSYGTVGLALLEREPERWTVRLLLTSCRVMSRGAGTVLLHHLVARAAEQGVALRSEFVHTGRNRTMFAMYRFAGFTEVTTGGDGLMLEYAPGGVSPDLGHSKVVALW